MYHLEEINPILNKISNGAMARRTFHFWGHKSETFEQAFHIALCKYQYLKRKEPLWLSGKWNRPTSAKEIARIVGPHSPRWFPIHLVFSAQLGVQIRPDMFRARKTEKSPVHLSRCAISVLGNYIITPGCNLHYTWADVSFRSRHSDS